MNVLKPIFLLGFICVALLPCFAQGTIIAWKTEAGVTEEHLSTTTHALLETGVLSRGTGMMYSNSSTYTYTGVFPTSSNTRAAAITSNAYYQMTFKTKEGAVLSLSGLAVRLRRANAATANKYCWRYSVDGGVTFQDVGPTEIALPFTGADDTNGHIQDPIDLSKVCALQHVSSATQIIFRMYAWGGTSTAVGANLGFGKSFFSSAANNPVVFTGAIEMSIPKVPILSWRPPSAIEEDLSATTVDANFQQALLSRGAGLTFSSSSTYTYTSNFPVNVTKSAAVSSNAYYEVVMKAKGGYYINLDGLVSRLRRSHAAAPNTYRWAYSLNGTNFTDVGPEDVALTMIAADDTNGEDQYYIDLSNIIALRNVPSSVQVTFRLYAWGATSASPNIGFGKSYVGTTATDYNALAFYGSITNIITTPVKLTSFRGKNEGRTVKLNWTTASEQNNSGFEILRSSIGKPTTAIAKVNGNGTSSTVHDYSYIDHFPLKGTNYYQLRQLDFDGKSELSEIIAVKQEMEQSGLHIISLETGITIYVHNAIEGKARVYIVDVTGKIILNKPVVLQGGRNVLNLSMNGNTGIYIASLTTADGRRLSTRFYKW